MPPALTVSTVSAPAHSLFTCALDSAPTLAPKPFLIRSKMTSIHVGRSKVTFQFSPHLAFISNYSPLATLSSLGFHDLILSWFPSYLTKSTPSQSLFVWVFAGASLSTRALIIGIPLSPVQSSLNLRFLTRQSYSQTLLQLTGFIFF